MQAELLYRLATRGAEEMSMAAKVLNPQFTVNGTLVVMSTVELAGVAKRSLGDKVTSLQNQRDEIIAALDLLFTGI
ncbi:CcdB family protein [Sulfuriferula thiophila]|uniref:CcdB family protein n=1 Tax=Sulfuriferula thiophila TaxID=1781211 RepID=UPI000F60CD02|nr:CcdB family protein [Sulfuriferula thiophila]